MLTNFLTFVLYMDNEVEVDENEDKLWQRNLVGWDLLGHKIHINANINGAKIWFWMTLRMNRISVLIAVSSLYIARANDNSKAFWKWQLPSHWLHRDKNLVGKKQHTCSSMAGEHQARSLRKTCISEKNMGTIDTLCSRKACKKSPEKGLRMTFRILRRQGLG